MGELGGQRGVSKPITLITGPQAHHPRQAGLQAYK